MQINYPILIISDVHTNLFNLRRLMNKHPNHSIICLGDIVNLWDKSMTRINNETVDYMIKRNIICLKGNHDEWVSGNPKLYNIDNNAVKYLTNLPMSMNIELPNNKRYQLYHYRPNDFWTLESPDKLSFDRFCNLYGPNDDVDAIIIGHLHSSYELTFPNHNRKLIGIGSLRDGDYSILTENGIQHLHL